MKFAFYTLGCKTNQYETQAMERLLTEKGHEIGSFDEACDGYIINTCSVTAVADKKNRAVIRRCRKQSPEAIIGVCGCYTQHAPEAVRQLGVDVIGGSGGRAQFLQDMLAALADRQEISFNETLRYNGGEYSHEEHRDYLAKDLFYFQLQEHTGKAHSRFVTIAPEGYDPHRRDLLNVRYRLQVQGDQPWLRDWLRQVEKSQPVYAGVDALMAPPQER